MKVCFLGDIVGASGREAVCKNIKFIKKTYDPDVVIANGENAAHGFGITPKICDELWSYGIDVITTGNHVWDQDQIKQYFDCNKPIVAPINFTKNMFNKGFYLHEVGGKKILIINIITRLYMSYFYENPFEAMSQLLEKYHLGVNIDAIFVDIHGEATSEKQAFARYYDGKVSIVAGTHIHVPTADAQILNSGTAYITDVGMCGDYDSIIGMDKELVFSRFLKPEKRVKLRPAQQEGMISGIFVEINKHGHADRIELLQLGKTFRTN